MFRSLKINKKIREEEEKRIEIRNKAAEYLAEFESKRKEEIAKKRMNKAQYMPPQYPPQP